jgi:1,5-anhydro-D-fructose reductase (1,5-anhydro-D-mannitol-forming)
MTQDPAGRVVLRAASGEREIEPDDRDDLYDVTLAAFAAAVAGHGRPLVDGVDGVRALAVASAVAEAAETGRTVPVTWRRDASITD